MVLTDCTNATISGDITFSSNIGFLYSEGSTNLTVSGISFTYPGNNRIYFGSGSDITLSNLTFGESESSDENANGYSWMDSISSGAKGSSRSNKISNSNEGEAYAVFVASSNSVTMTNCKFYSLYTGGAGFNGAETVSISGCTFSGNKLGVQPNLYRTYSGSSYEYAAISLLIWGATTATVSSCEFDGNKVALENWGLYADSTTSSSLSARTNNFAVVQTEQRSGDVIIGNTASCTMSQNTYSGNVVSFEHSNDEDDEWQYIAPKYKNVTEAIVNIVHYEMNRQASTVMFVEGSGSVTMKNETVSDQIGGFVYGESLSSFDMSNSTLSNITTTHECMNGAAMSIGLSSDSTGSVTLTNVNVSDVTPRRADSVFDEYEFSFSGFDAIVPTWSATNRGGRKVWNYGNDGKYKIRQESMETEFGGALVISSGSGVIKSSNFKNVKANGYGGAILIKGQDSISISDTTFDSCVAGVSGGAVAIDHSLSSMSVEMTKCTFTSCTAGRLGGGLYIPVDQVDSSSESEISNDEASKISLTLTNTTFTSCVAGEGGAVYYSQRENSSATCITSSDVNVTYSVTNGAFSQCSATYGGGIYSGVVQFAENISLTNVSASDCSSYMSGGFAFVMMPCDEVSGTFSESKGTYDGNNAAGFGGAIYVRTGSHDESSTSNADTSSTVTFANSKFQNGDANSLELNQSGSAFAIISYVAIDVTFTECTFTNNAHYAIDTNGIVSLNISGSNFTGATSSS